MTKKKSRTSSTEAETMAIAREFAAGLQPGNIVALRGGLGAGKTRFVKGAASAFGVDPATVQSPTFSLIHEYGGNPPVYHFDFYRLDSEKEALNIGAEEYFYGSGVCFIEWPERVLNLLPEETIWIELTKTGENERRIIL